MVKINQNPITIEELQEQVKNLIIEVQDIKKQLKKNDKNNKNIKIKDPNAPKRNINAFFHFNNEKREQFKKDNPEEKVYVAKLTKEAKESWDKLNETQKKKYEDIAKKDEKRYERELKKYNDKKLDS